MQGRREGKVPVFHAAGCAVQEELQHRRLSVLRCDVHGRHPVFALRVDVRTLLQQELDQRQVTEPDGRKQSGASFIVRILQVGATGEEEPHDGEVSGLCCEVKRRRAVGVAVSIAGVGVVAQQMLTTGFVAVLGRQVQRL
eukprot:scaffold1277_cov253-Pinguiococcus_pyrenoidosus.AAC.15